ncbi:Methylase of chemotaxis methyl-accepting proteins [Streptomyces sp. LamerLS-316]|uniref:SAM-dependent methyltransferase n=1 Tax=unclassified Streptomyces TaxID=2593676 RepID=UPI000823A434|nr:SAM-dependent methyltransferase [Streptomyces sp. LamerLS-316]MYQ42116.1 methyltransferase domain-containing protein [Streptomyces sp. SID4921]SCK30467.1 Methylase of chemotaxis methyl-accepting proteins [Streptomyces sp. LamerLS-316]
MSTPAGYFEEMYRGEDDPWHLRERWYEQRKYALTLASLPRPRFRNAFEPACSVGQLTRMLAPRCERLLAADRVASAVDTTRRRTADLGNVEVERLTVPEEWPEGRFDLVVLSELLYYFDGARLDALLARATGSLEPGGTLVTVHWNHPVPEHLYTGAQLAGRLAREPGLLPRTDHREEDFVLQTFSRVLPGGAAPLSPAAFEGLV